MQENNKNQLHNNKLYQLQQDNTQSLPDDFWKEFEQPQQEQKSQATLPDNFFDDFVIEVIIDKKYLTKEQLEVLNQEPILFDLTEPF